MSPGSVSEAEVSISGRHNVTRARGWRPRAPLRSCTTVFLLLIVNVVVGCQRGGDIGETSQQKVPISGNHPPSIRAASLVPSPLVLNGPVSVTIDAQDLDRNPLSFRYQWSVNGQAIPREQGEQIRPELLKRGDRVSVEIWPYDGTIEGPSFITPGVTIGNSPPVVSRVAVEPELIVPGMRVRVLADVQDADHDLIQVRYRWWRNQTVVQEGEETELDTTSFARADTLSVEAVASDGSSIGQPVRSALIKIGNTPPRIASVPPTSLENNQFVYQVKVNAAESDAVTFSLEAAPPGMTIDAQKGLLLWPIPQGETGVHKVRILVTDSQGAASFQDFEINVSTLSSQGKV